MELVTLKYQDLVDGKDLTAEIAKAYGPNGLGALTVSGIPGYLELRERLLPLGHRVAHLPEESKKKLEDEPSMWNVGWSHGKEKLGDQPDFAKGSFYGNPLFDEPASEEVRQKYPFFYPKNIWPTEDIPELESAFKNLGKVMYEVVVLLAKQVDKFTIAKKPAYQKDLLHSEMAVTKKIKGRLLYYYPTDKTQDEDAWIGWHNDSGFLTALTCDMYFDDETGERIENPDPNGGLWIVNRAGGSVKVNIPPDHLAIQCGECLQIITGGLLVATPHCVRASKSPSGQKVGRATYPVFIDTGMDFALKMPQGTSRDDVFDHTIKSRVPPLEKRWLEDGVPFVDFLGTTFKQYYEWAKAGGKDN